MAAQTPQSTELAIRASLISGDGKQAVHLATDFLKTVIARRARENGPDVTGAAAAAAKVLAAAAALDAQDGPSPGRPADVFHSTLKSALSRPHAAPRRRPS